MTAHRRHPSGTLHATYEYRTPRRDMQFVLHEALEAERVLAVLGRSGVSRELMDSILEQGARFTATVASPLNWQGDWTEPKLDNGCVVTRPGFRATYQHSCRDGWAGTAAGADERGRGEVRSRRCGRARRGSIPSPICWRMARAFGIAAL